MEEKSIKYHGFTYFKMLRILYPEDSVEIHRSMANEYMRYAMHIRIIKEIDKRFETDSCNTRNSNITNTNIPDNNLISTRQSSVTNSTINSICKNCGSQCQMCGYGSECLLSHDCPACGVNPNIQRQCNYSHDYSKFRRALARFRK